MNNKVSFLRKAFTTWKPNVPKHKIVIDKQSYRLAHPVWSLQDAETVNITHQKPAAFRDWVSFYTMKALRSTFDVITNYKPGQMTEAKYLQRFIFLETVAGVPGMVGGMIRHMKALRSMTHDGGWIHHLLEEAENERMHLFTFIKLRNPGLLFRLAVLATQAVFLMGFSATYLLSSRTAHRFVGYLEEEAVKTYTNCIKELDEGKLSRWVNMKASEDSLKYWGLPEGATFRDVLVAVRADEVMHREVNHHLGDLDPETSLDGHKYVVVDEMVGEATRKDKDGKTW